jgi:hypothetical protein
MFIIPFHYIIILFQTSSNKYHTNNFVIIKQVHFILIKWNFYDHSELIGFWTLSIVWYSKKLENTTFRKLDLFPSSGQGEGGWFLVSWVQWLRLALSKGPNWLGVLPPWPEDGNRSSFRKVVFSNFLEYQTMDKVQKPINSECYTPSSEPIRIYFYDYYFIDVCTF